MKNIRIIIITIIAAAIGLGAGYLLFRSPAEQHNLNTGVAGDKNPAETTVYTCSMHPQIRQNEPGLCPICEMELVPLSDASSSGDPLTLQMTLDAVRLANVQTTVIGEKGQSSKAITLNGKISADERRAANQVAHVPGRIEKLYVTFTGELVQKGQRLAEIYSPELVTAQRELLEALRFQDVNPKLAQAAREKLRRWKIPQQMIEELEKTGVIQENVTVYADAGGVVRKRLASVGDYVREGEALFALAELSRLWVLFDAYEDDLAHLHTGDVVAFTTPVLPGRQFSTRITYIDPVIDPASRTAALRAEINNSSGLLKPEMFVKGVIQAREATGKQLLVPRSAVLWTGQRSVVYLKVPNSIVPTFEYREVALGEALGNNYLVREGLMAGDEVVTNGAFAIDAAAQLNNQASMMNRQVMVEGMAAPAAPDFRESTPPSFRQQMEALSKRYLKLKDALVATDSLAAAKAGEGFLEGLNQVDMGLLQGPAHHFWMGQLNAMRTHAGKIAKAKNVEEERKQFDFLSTLLIETIRAFGTEGHQLYIQHCPMAFDDRGADWISEETQILNPYFGDKMLKCGVVKDSLFTPTKAL
ncbi:MAG: efflux RND transporter periplasmic adaptor subunit [Lewinellaceae bacterium]|nr:efflux RND transporter periplasmic adaptor subunit [Lewinellaceae bacterium]